MILLKVLESIGCNIKKINLKYTGLGVSAYQVVAPAECSSNLSRFDGVRFEHRSDSPQALKICIDNLDQRVSGKKLKDVYW